jgi:predicted metal-dependent HD superfamily phosphohydrolase
VKKYHSLRPNSAFSEGSEQHRTEVKNDIQDLDLDEWIHDRIKDCLFSKNEKIFC